MRITLLFEPSSDRAIPFAAGPERYQRLADELCRYAGVQLQIVKGALQQAPVEAYVLFAGARDVSRSLADCGPALAAKLAPKTVLLDVSWQNALEQLEKYRLAGAVDSLRLSEWLARPSSYKGPFGLRYLTEVLGASCVPLPAFRSAHYCLLQSKRHRGLPHLLADYLIAYDRDQRPLSVVPSVSVARVIRAFRNDLDGRRKSDAERRAGGIPTSQVESVSLKRAISSLKTAREAAHLTLQKVAERSGLDIEQLACMEGNDYSRATLGTLRAYFRALEATCGWTLADMGLPGHRAQELEQDPVGTASDGPVMVPRTGVSRPSASLGEADCTPPAIVERGMTVLGNRRLRRHLQVELDRPTVQTQVEEHYAGV
jgi:hypothetical protein